jgi:hypothetical protein
MRGIQYVVNDKGQVSAVLIDLKKLGRLWEDFQDIVLSHARRKERRYTLANVEARVRKRRNN